MTRADKKNRECICCGKVLVTSQKLYQHYTSIKNQCRLLLTSFNFVYIHIQQNKDQESPVPRLQSPTSASVVHAREKD